MFAILSSPQLAFTCSKLTIFEIVLMVPSREKRLICLLLENLFSRTEPATTCSKLTIETLEKGVKYVQS